MCVILFALDERLVRLRSRRVRRSIRRRATGALPPQRVSREGSWGLPGAGAGAGDERGEVEHFRANPIVGFSTSARRPRAFGIPVRFVVRQRNGESCRAGRGGCRLWSGTDRYSSELGLGELWVVGSLDSEVERLDVRREQQSTFRGVSDSLKSGPLQMGDALIFRCSC